MPAPRRTTNRSRPPASRPKRPSAEALHLSEEKFAKTFHISPEMILISTLAEGRCLEANDSFLRLTGYTREEVIGRTTRELNLWVNPEQRAIMVQQVAACGSVRDLEVEYRRKSGERGIALMYVEPLVIDGEQCLITMGHDVTAHWQAEAERKRTEQQLSQYAAELQARNEDLNAFSRTVAHDLKSPLGNIIGFVEWLQSHPEMSEAERKEYIDIILRNAVKMDNIIDEMLLLAQMHKADVETLPLDTARLVSEAQARLAFILAGTGAVIQLPGTWPIALGYGPWVEEVWVNYLSNAIKYGGHPPRIELGSEQQPDRMIRFWVRDNGPGIAPEDQAQLFRAFGEHSKVRATGHGLGLSIVKAIVEKMGGQVGVESEASKGSKFYFTLPALE